MTEEKNPLTEMLYALNANMEYLRQEGDMKLKVKNGEFLDEIRDFFIYKFTLDFFQDIDPDTDIEIRIKNASANGKLISISEKEIKIELDKFLGPSIPEAQLIITSIYLLQSLHDKLEKVKNGETKLSDLPEKLFQIKKSLRNFQIKSESQKESTGIINESQQKAIRLALESEVSFIWGPPGTGKTLAIARIVEGLLEKKLSVLLVSHTNIATDGALLQVVEYFKNSLDYFEGKFLRIGNVQKHELKEYEYVNPEFVLEQKIAPIKEELEKIESRIEQLSRINEASKKIIEKFHLLESIKKERIFTRNEISKLENARVQSKKELMEIDLNLEEIQKQINDYQTSGFFWRILFGANPEKLADKKRLLLFKKDKRKKLISSNEETVSHVEEKLKSINQKIENLVNDLSSEDFNQHLGQVEKNGKEIQLLTEQTKSLTDQLDESEKEIISEANVISTTLTKCYTSKLVLDRDYDCLILDEASMAPLPSLWYAAGITKKKVIIVGDFYQLPPVVKHKVIKNKNMTNLEIEKEERLVEKWLRQNIYDFSGITRSIQSGIKPDFLEQLKIQYRMLPQIAEVLNLLVYGKFGDKFKLESGVQTNEYGIERIDKNPLKGGCIGFYTTSEMNTYPVKTDSGSHFNLYQALLCVNLAKEAINSGYSNIGIISPFRAQITLIQRILKDENLLKNVQADTVHRYQGGEKQLTIFDLTVGNPTKLTDDLVEGGDDEKLINVAFSRAKEKCIIVADLKTIESKHSSSSMFKKLLNSKLGSELPVIPVENILPWSSVKQETEKWLEKINDIDLVSKEVSDAKLFDQTDFYPNFIRDLLNSETEIIIDSPYITEERSKQFFPIFEYLIGRGINIFLITRKPKEHDSAMKYHAEKVISDFENMGITVLPFRGKIHRKLALIDRKILWEGSLNILSQRDSHEIMRRFFGEETSNQMMKFLKLDLNIGKLGENKLSKCDFCKEPGSWYWTDKSKFGGLWTFCLTNNHKAGQEPKTKEEIKEKKKILRNMRKAEKTKTEEGVPICQEHDLPMVIRNGRFGKFWGCVKYPRCKIIHKME